MQHTVAGILSIVNLTYESKKLHPQLLLVTFTASKKDKVHFSKEQCETS